MMNVRILNPYGKGGAGGTEKAGIRARLARKAKPLLNDLAARDKRSLQRCMEYLMKKNAGASPS